MSTQKQPENTQLAEDRERIDPKARIEKQIAELRVRKSQTTDPTEYANIQYLIDEKEEELKMITAKENQS